MVDVFLFNMTHNVSKNRRLMTMVSTKPPPSRNLMTSVAVVEDNVTLRSFVVDLINSAAGYRCVGDCGSAEEALVQLPKLRPDVVLMDIHLPGQSGVACTARLREKLPETQVIILTVYKDITKIFEALKAGACGYLLKRSKESEILDAIAEVRAGGAPMTSEIARLLVRSFREPAASNREPSQLSTRETEILVLLAEGLSNKEIAVRLFLGVSTVRTHLLHIYEKLHVRGRTEAAARYLRSRAETTSH
jgi:DNA-binding NarL/FixJ family response regulator